MTIKKSSANEIVVEGDNVQATVDFSNKESLKVNLTRSESETLIDKPGEYGYLDSLVEAYEVRGEKAKAQIHLSIVEVGGVRVLFVLNGSELTKEDLAKLANIRIIVFNSSDNAKVKTLENELEPKVVMLVKNNESDLEEFKKEFGIAELNIANKYSYNSKDFDSEVETPVSYVVLGK